MYSHRTSETASRALAIGFLSMLACLPVLAGNTDSPAPPGDPTAHLPSFAEVCARLVSGANPGAPPGSFVEPGGPPVNSPLCDLQDLLNMTPAPDNVAGATPGEVVCGKSYWGLRTDGSWGLQSGTRACTGCELDCAALFDKPNSFGQCNTGGAEPVCELVCCSVGSDNPACDGVSDYFDLNGVLTDGCEFQPDPDAIYVSESDPAAADTSGCGTDPWLPCATISFGIGEAVSSARSQVLVADGAYDESITVQDGISLLGGHRADTWERNVSATGTAIYGGGGGGSHRKTITVSGVSSTTTVEGFLVYGQQNVNPSGNSYAVWIANTGTALSLINNRIIAGRGGDGTPGFAEASGSFGAPGGSGSDSIQTTANTLSACNASPSTPGSGGSGGFQVCEATSVNGGDGADAQCPNLNSRQSTGDNGLGASGGAGGSGGYDRVSDCGAFSTGGLPATGEPGANGQDGFDGTGGSGCSVPGGFVSSNEWLGSSGSSGVDGAHGGGGGGGGAGGGADRGNGCSGDGDALGGSGGGGGSGGCAGGAGGSGASGGGSFGVFVSFSGPSALFPTISGNVITGNRGGNGGGGGSAGAGGGGGNGGSGGTVSGTWAFAMGVGGGGGDGGNGGSGGGGGGACGGVAYGIYTHNISGSPPYASANTFSPGVGGSAGAGGASLGNSGSSGAAGSSGDLN